MHINDEQLDLAAIVKSIWHMNQLQLNQLQAAIDERRSNVTQTVVAQRRSYRDGILQLEHHRNPKTGHVGPGYWYFRFRQGGSQRSLYVGKTDQPECVTDSKLGKDTDSEQTTR